ncbi:MAG: hypothetical protein KME27_27885 [Lyngbya sp. HA4199-MV5]|jgi:hypothetical protein|nr:hypothetical protein [Lyngbya sp. HA4199-MV5]
MQQFLSALNGGEMTWMQPPEASPDDPLILWLKPRSSLRWQPYTQFPALMQPDGDGDPTQSKGIATMHFLKARGWRMVAPPG